MEFFDFQKATKELEREWNLYISLFEKWGKYSYPDQMEPRASEFVKRITLRPEEVSIAGIPSYLSLRKVLFCLQQVWHPPITSFIVGLLFEAMLQVQQSFEELRNRNIPLFSLPGEFAFAYYRKQPRDKFPHRGLLARLNAQAIKGLVVVHDPNQKITAAFGSKCLPRQVWRSFVELLLEKEGEHIWYVPTQANGEYAKFVLNGTESFMGVPPTALHQEGLFEIFSCAVESNRRASHSSRVP
jgi:hypothetical protein